MHTVRSDRQTNEQRNGQTEKSKARSSTTHTIHIFNFNLDIQTQHKVNIGKCLNRDEIQYNYDNASIVRPLTAIKSIE